MATALDVEMVQEALDVIDEFGTTMTFRTFPSRTQNEGEGSVTNGTPTDYALKVSPPDRAMRALSDDGLGVRVLTQRFVLPSGAGTSRALSFTPERGELVIDGTAQRRILKVTEFHSGDEIAAYEIDIEA